MKKLYIIALLGLLIPSISQATLYDYYSGLGKNLPSIAERSVVYSEVSDDTYLGTAEQNNALESYLRGSEVLGATTKIKLTDPNSVTPYATSTPTAGKIPIADGNGKLDDGWMSDNILGIGEFFGDGSDGDVVTTTSSTLTRDMYYNNFTVNTGVVINTGGYRIFVRGTLTNNGTIARNGNAGGNGGTPGTNVSAGGIGGTAGAALAAGTLEGSIAGKAGGAGGDGAAGVGNAGKVGTAGTNTTVAFGAINAVAGGNGGGGGIGANAGGAGGAGQAGGTSAVAGMLPKNIFNAYYFISHTSDTAFSRIKTLASPGSGGGGGGGGGNNSANASGGGGGGGSASPGGVVMVFAREFINNGVLSANGANGGNGGNGGENNSAVSLGAGGGGGGGGGSNGGTIILVYGIKTGAGTITVTGGTGGSGGAGGINTANPAFNGSAGVAGANGSDGVIFEFSLGLN